MLFAFMFVCGSLMMIMRVSFETEKSNLGLRNVFRFVLFAFGFRVLPLGLGVRGGVLSGRRRGELVYDSDERG
jgi:hypothetical protein